jgi:hypothetical protein
VQPATTETESSRTGNAALRDCFTVKTPSTS